MATRLDIAGLAAAAPVSAALPVAALGEPGQESLRWLLTLETSKAFQAEVLSRLANGEFVVGIAGTAARMALPAGTRVGEPLTLTLVAREPRPLFMLEQPGAQDHAVFSPAARLIAGLLHNSPAGQPALPGVAPLAPSAGALAAAPLESALKDSLAYSGLFYESHVAEWANGGRTMAQLLREPQMQAAHVKPPDAWSELRAYLSGGAADGAPVTPVAAMDLDAGRLVRQQLDTLEHRSLTWQGELFPGQPMQWEVREQNGQASAEPLPPAERGWQSVVRFELPALGTVAATLHLRGGHLQLQVRTDSDAAAAALRDGGAVLAAALEAAGLPLDLMTVRHEAG
ncbi:MAG: flagellar hook-length control protein FliK [Noviherbaspirillum sp.]